MANDLAILERYDDPVAGHLVGAVVRGARYLVGGATFFARDAKLRRLSLIPAIVNLMLLAAFVIAGFVSFPTVLGWLVPRSGAGWVMLKIGVGILLVPLTILAALLLTMIVGSIINGEVYAAISARAEALILGRTLTESGGALRLVREVGREIWLQLGLLVIYIAGASFLFAIGLVPLVGPLVAAPAGLLWTWYLLAFECLSPSLSRHGLTAPQQLTALLHPRAVCLGFGSAAWLVLLLLVTTPWAIVGGTRMYLALAAHDHLPSRLDEAERGALRRRPQR